MSLTSCFRYIIELPSATLNEFLRAAFSESDGAASRQWPGLPIDTDYTADVSVRPTDVDTNPPTLDLSATDLESLLHLRMRVEVDVIELPELDPIVYTITFDLPGKFEKDAATPPVLWLRFPNVTAGAINLNVTGGQIVLTPALIEPRVHDMYDANPELGHTVLNNQPWVDLGTGPTTVQITIDIYDDEPGSAGFKGAITVQVLTPTSFNVKMPGHFKSQGINTTYMNTDMTVDVVVDVEQTDGLITPKFSQVTAADVTVTFATPSAYDLPASVVMEGEIATRLSALDDDDFAQAFPTQADVRTLIEQQIVLMAGDLEFPLFTPPMPSGDDPIDLTTFVPETVAQQVLALKLEPLGDATPCDTPDVFAHATGFAIAVSAVRVNQELEGLETDNEGSVTEVQGYDVTLLSLELALADGHITVSGTATAEVDCWEDPEVDFDGSVTLVPSLESDGTIKVTADAGVFTADDPCCGDVDPADIAAVVEGDSRSVGNLPTDFSGVGQLALTVDSCDISTAGIVIHGGMTVLTTSQLSAGMTKRRSFWHLEPAGGG